MKTYNIPMSNDDIDLVILSVASFAKRLAESMNTVRLDSDNASSTRNYVGAILGQGDMAAFQGANETFRYVPREKRNQEKETFPPAAPLPTAVFAPYGLKKDGSAAKRRGRPASKTKKVTA